MLRSDQIVTHHLSLQPWEQVQVAYLPTSRSRAVVSSVVIQGNGLSIMWTKWAVLIHQTTSARKSIGKGSLSSASVISQAIQVPTLTAAAEMMTLMTLSYARMIAKKMLTTWTSHRTRTSSVSWLLKRQKRNDTRISLKFLTLVAHEQWTQTTPPKTQRQVVTRKRRKSLGRVKLGQETSLMIYTCVRSSKTSIKRRMRRSSLIARKRHTLRFLIEPTVHSMKQSSTRMFNNGFKTTRIKRPHIWAKSTLWWRLSHLPRISSSNSHSTAVTLSSSAEGSKACLKTLISH